MVGCIRDVNSIALLPKLLKAHPVILVGPLFVSKGLQDRSQSGVGISKIRDTGFLLERNSLAKHRPRFLEPFPVGSGLSGITINLAKPNPCIPRHGGVFP